MKRAGMNREAKAEKYKQESGTAIHSSDCATSVAPAEEPGPCDCLSVNDFWPIWKRNKYGVDRAATKNTYDAFECCEFARAYHEYRKEIR